MHIKLIAATLCCAISNDISFAATENVDDISRCSFLRSAQELFQVDDSVRACKEEGKKAIHVYQSALSILNDKSFVFNEARAEKEERIRWHERRLADLRKEHEATNSSTRAFVQTLSILKNADLGVIVGKIHGGIDFGSSLFVPKQPFKLDVYTVLTGENDRDCSESRFRCAAVYEAFSLTNEERSVAVGNYDTFMESFKASRKSTYELRLSGQAQKAERLSAEIADLESNRTSIIKEIQDDIDAKVKARSDMHDLIEIESLKYAFQCYGNALNAVRTLGSGEQEKITRLKTAIEDLLPTLSEKTLVWLNDLFPEYQWTVVTKKKRVGFQR